jgi:CRISPR/Cas system CSM-associated protein Csm3 (group 7 of RAMP superfamily)
MSGNKKQYNYRYIARIVIEAKTPIAVSNGNSNMVTDSMVVTDVNGLPYIPGTSIAGVIRHAIGENVAKQFFGYQNPEKSNDGHGSEIIFTDAKMVSEDGNVIDGMKLDIDWESDFYNHFKNLPIRQHVKINERGVTNNGSKFDEQIVFKGTRFCFEIEMVSDKKGSFYKVIDELCSDDIRLGSGTRSGFGDFKVIKDQSITKELDLTKNEDLAFYLKTSSNLSEKWDGDTINTSVTEDKDSKYSKYELTLIPEDFFLFGSGMGDADADMTPAREDFIVWEGNKGKFKTEAVLIPATSIKGALSHRVAFYWNKNDDRYADNDTSKEPMIGSENPAVSALFGSDDSKNPKRGNALFFDIIEARDVVDKVLNHVAIDRFTGGAIDSALFTEKTIYGNDNVFCTSILVNSEVISDKTIGKPLESAMIDICKGLLPLGGGVNRGNGCFTGTLKRNGNIIYSKEGGTQL